MTPGSRWNPVRPSRTRSSGRGSGGSQPSTRQDGSAEGTPDATGRRDAIALGSLTLILYGLTCCRYGYFRDELYYLANAEHPGFGYVDHPPMIGWVTALVRATLGDSLLAVRAMPVLAGAVTVALVALIARDLGAGRFGRWLAGLAAMLTPGFLALFSFLSMNALDVLVWTAALWLLVRILDSSDGRPWLAFGVVAGVGLLTKLDVLLLGVAVVVGLLLGGRAGLLRERRAWLAAAIAALLFLPHVIWQVVHGWPTLEFMRRAAALKIAPLSAPAFLDNQVLMAGPVNAVVLVAGVGFLLFASGGRWRPLGIAWLAVLAALLVTSAKPYYLVPSYGMLLAAGGVALERATRRIGGALRATLLILVLLVGLALAPLARPILPVETFVDYAAAVGMMPEGGERHELGALPQHFADRFGWRELAETVARVYRALPAEDRARACVFADNYGQAGAVDLWGEELGLPPVISGHNSYWLWGPGECSGEVMIVIGADEADLREVFEEVKLATLHHCRWCMPYEDENPIWVARRLRLPLGELWPAVKDFI